MGAADERRQPVFAGDLAGVADDVDHAGMRAAEKYNQAVGSGDKQRLIVAEGIRDIDAVFLNLLTGIRGLKRGGTWNLSAGPDAIKDFPGLVVKDETSAQSFQVFLPERNPLEAAFAAFREQPAFLKGARVGVDVDRAADGTQR